jgi:hypothetical protein
VIVVGVIVSSDRARQKVLVERNASKAQMRLGG